MIAGVDIGGTKIAVAGFDDVADGLRRITEVHTVPTPSDAGGDEIVRTVVEALAALPMAPTLVGVGTAGVVGQDGAIASSTDAIRGWAGYPLGATLQRQLGLPAVILNDVHAAAVAEAAVGAAASAQSMLMVTVGTGIGGAVLLPGGLHRGLTGTAGSVGHMEIALPAELAERRCPCGVQGHVEAVASGPAMEQTYRHRTGRSASLRDVAALARSGDAIADGVIAEAARLLGHALAGANALLDVDTIVIGGGVAQIGALYLQHVEAAYQSVAMPGPRRARIVPAALGVDATLTGAALFVHDRRR